MITEDKDIRKQYGADNHFSVPEDYFDNLTDRVMAAMPEQEPHSIAVHQSIWVRLRPVILAAACICVAIFSITVYFAQSDKGSSSDVQAHQKMQIQATSDAYVNAAADYAMMDNTDIYACITGE